jgi:hypothetical protein
MGLSRIGFNFSVKKFPVNLNFDVRVNCRQDFTFLRYNSSFSSTSAGIAFLNSEPISVRNNILIRDLTENLPENSPRKFFERTYNDVEFEVETGDFAITDVFKTTSKGEVIPLYLRHSLNQYQNISNVEILDANFSPVNKDIYSYYDESVKLGRNSKHIYTNLINSYDQDTNTYTVYYYRFTDTSTGKFVTGLLDTKKFYQPVDFDTLQNERAYRLEPGTTTSVVKCYFNSFQFSPTPAESGPRFSVKSEGGNRIAVLPPLSLPTNNRWYARITRGEFYRNVSGRRLFYYVPEYYNQFFSPVPPFKNAIEQEATFVEDRMIYTNPSPMAALGISGFYVYVVFKDEFNRAVRAVTDDPNANFYINKEKVLTDIFYEKDIIQSIDSEHGFIRLNEPMDTSLKVYVSYRYIESHFTYRDINVNSTINPEILNTKVIFYIKPEGVAKNSRSVHHLEVDEYDNIIGASESQEFVSHRGFTSQESLTEIQDNTLQAADIYEGFELEILAGKNSGRKIKIDNYDKITKKIHLQEPAVHPIKVGTPYIINKKTKAYSRYDSVTESTFVYEGWNAKYSASPFYYLSLAELFPIQTLVPSDIETLDVRIRGGGIKEKYIETALSLQDELQWYWDVGYWDGQSYPGMGAIIVEIPRKVLEESGGEFTRAQVADIVRKHMAEGCHPIIRYYDQSTNIIQATPGNGKVDISWEDVDASFYNVYYGVAPTGLELYRNLSGSVTSITIDNLDNNRMYYFRVHSVVRSVEQLPSKTIMAIPFDPSTVLDPAIYGITKFGQGTYKNG